MRTATSGATAPKGGGQRASCAACADEGPSRPPFLLFHAYHSGRSGIRGLGPVSSVIWSTVTLPAEPRRETNVCAGSYRVPKFGLFLTWGDRQGAAVGVGVSRVRPPALPGLRPALRLALVPLGRSSAPKNAELPVLRHDVAVLRRTGPRLRLDWADQAVMAALIRLLPGKLRVNRLITPGTVLPQHRRPGHHEMDPSAPSAPGGVCRRRSPPRAAITSTPRLSRRTTDRDGSEAQSSASRSVTLLRALGGRSRHDRVKFGVGCPDLG